MPYKNKEKRAAHMKQYYEANKEANKPKQMVSSSKRSDIKYNRYDPTNHITEAFICTTFDNQNGLCYHCGCQIAFDAEIRANHLATIERLDNAIGHIQTNCVFVCLACNNRYYKCLYKELLQNVGNVIEEISYSEKDIGFNGVSQLVLDHLSGWINSNIVSGLEDKIDDE